MGKNVQIYVTLLRVRIINNYLQYKYTKIKNEKHAFSSISHNNTVTIVAHFIESFPH